MTKSPLLCLAFVLFLSALNLSASTSLTIYNQEFAVVREQFPVSLEKGQFGLVHSGVSNLVETDSVILRDPSGKSEFTILEQNYRNDPLSINALLKENIGKELEFEVKHDDGFEVVTGTVIRVPEGAVPNQYLQYYRQYNNQQQNNQPIIEIDGKWRFGLPGTPLFPVPTDDTLTEPSFQWHLYAPKAAEFDAELAYLSRGFTWKADYNLVASEDSDLVDIRAWVTLENYSGATYEDAKVKLVAGDVNKLDPQNRNRSNEMMMLGAGVDPFGAGPQVTEKSFDEYHLYSLPLPLDIHDAEKKQVELLSASGVQTKRIYVYDGMEVDRNSRNRYQYSGSANTNRSYGTDSNPKVWVMREFENTEENNLGMPLPAGIVRFYRQDSDDGQLEFTGENIIDHTPKDETVIVYTGDSFDIVGERTRTDYEYDSRRNFVRETYEIKLRNHKDEAVEVRIAENLWRWSNWEITEHSDPFLKTDSSHIEFRVQVKPDEEKTVTYTVLYTW